MKPIKFAQMNNEIAKSQKEYITLPVHMSKDGVVTSCWKLTLYERFKILITGKMFLQIMTFNKQLQPQKLTINTPIY